MQSVVRDRSGSDYVLDTLSVCVNCSHTEQRCEFTPGSTPAVRWHWLHYPEIKSSQKQISVSKTGHLYRQVLKAPDTLWGSWRPHSMPSVNPGHLYRPISVSLTFLHLPLVCKLELSCGFIYEVHSEEEEAVITHCSLSAAEQTLDNVSGAAGMWASHKVIELLDLLQSRQRMWVWTRPEDDECLVICELDSISEPSAP